MERWLACARDIVTSIELGGVDEQLGPTPLIAACRAIVADKLGDEVDIPEELTQ